MMVVVMRAFSGPDGKLMINQLVDATGWKNRALLLDQNYIRVATEQDLASAQEVIVEEPVSAPTKPAPPTIRRKPKRK